jgi:hypothetical protein
MQLGVRRLLHLYYALDDTLHRFMLRAFQPAESRSREGSAKMDSPQMRERASRGLESASNK